MKEQPREGDRVRVRFRGDVPVVTAELLYTTDRGLWKERRWETTPAQIDRAASLATATLPPTTTVYFLNFVDEKRRIVSSEHAVIP